MVSGEFEGNDKDEFFIDRDGRYFHHILNFLRCASLPDKVIYEAGDELLAEADYYNIQGLVQLIKDRKDGWHYYGGPYRSNTIHLSKTQYTYRKHNTFIENKIQLSKTQYTYRKHNTFIENTIHLSKTQNIYRKHNTFIENKIKLSKTQYTY